ncbi:putative serine protease PepD [Actinopolymorpha cephalotaxi]|uniref:Serine protease PepD n=1 Tax=Actinopolymorpha cephalotaxi TaxID=504797 RepID=A0A1I3AAM1_9ACTN|nr:trypsin-like peptidase domain-containing protein [Actinopolymorpha cephalotaxi]NYH85257.1 putative serine protease PepD [Actinopolymorpha cephalotaxi]SFH46876.1 putative serine protease PepD [Actinopolymorpha cephalotaxi]
MTETTPSPAAPDRSGGQAFPPPSDYAYGQAPPSRPSSPYADQPPRPHRPRRRGVPAVAALALVAGLVGGGAGSAATYFTTRDQAASGAGATALDQSTATIKAASNAPAGSVQQVANKVLPSVVLITISTAQESGNGSGIVLSKDGLILTNNHVAEAAQGEGLSVTFSNGKTAKATVVGADLVTDLAVIKAGGVSGLTPATLGSSADLSVGQAVVAIGSPLGLSGTVTSGIVSALDRPVPSSDSGQSQSTVTDAIQTDAAINPGNSGGALVNMAGQVVGINSSAILSGSGQQEGGSIGLGFAIPIDEAKPIAEQLIAKGHAEHAQLGVAAGTSTGSDGVSGGATLGTVTAGGAAAKAGLQQGDVVTKVDERPVADADALVAAIRSYRPGDKVTLTYVRNGATHTATVTLGTDGGNVQQAGDPSGQDEQGQSRQPSPWSS